MKRNLTCFSASRVTSITGLSCADTEEESDQETDESSNDGMDENDNENTSSIRNNYAGNENGSETIRTKWPYIFQISDYMLLKRIINHLNTAGALNESDRRVLFAGIFDECIKFTFLKVGNIFNNFTI